MTVSFHLEPFDALLGPDGQAVFQAHYDEIARDKERSPMEPDVTIYKVLEAQGALVVLTARADGLIVGYVVAFIRRHTHYKLLCAFEDAYFLLPEHRKGLTGYKMIKRMLKELKARGVEKAFFHTKTFKPLGKLFARMGFTHCDEIYSTWL